MVNVAIAGGTGAVGRSLADVMAVQSKHTAIVLSRKGPGDGEDFPVPIIQADYNDVDSLVALLEAHNIHTVICAFGINPTSLAISQMNIIKAADASSVTKRFIPSSFATPYPKDAVSVLPPLEHYFASLNALEASSLEWSVVHNGTFLEYFAPASLKTYLPRCTLVLDIEHNAAAIPGNGNNPITLTYMLDVARFVVAALDLDKWPRELRIVGDELTFNELVALAEEIKGCKFDVAYDSVEKLKASQITELPGHRESYAKYPKVSLLPFLAIFELWMATGKGHIPREGALNDMFPAIKPLTARDMMEQYWKV